MVQLSVSLTVSPSRFDRKLQSTVAPRRIASRTRDNLHEVARELYFLVIFVELEYPARYKRACTSSAVDFTLS